MLNAGRQLRELSPVGARARIRASFAGWPTRAPDEQMGIGSRPAALAPSHCEYLSRSGCVPSLGWVACRRGEWDDYIQLKRATLPPPAHPAPGLEQSDSSYSPQWGGGADIGRVFAGAQDARRYRQATTRRDTRKIRAPEAESIDSQMIPRVVCASPNPGRRKRPPRDA